MTCVHVEGVDGSGKSTLAKELASQTGLRLIPTEGPPKSWEECLARVKVRLQPGVVCDRSSGLVSELVYGPVLRGGTLALEEDFWDLLRSVIGSVVFVYCRPPVELIQPRRRTGEDPVHASAVEARIAELVKRYDWVMGQIVLMGGQVIRYDWTKMSPEEVIRCVA